MSEPTRLRDEGPDPVRALLRHAPRTRTMTPDDRARTRARLGRAAVGLAAGAGSLAWFQGAAIGAGLGLLTVGAAEILPPLLAPQPPTGAVTTRDPRTSAAVPPARVEVPRVSAVPPLPAVAPEPPALRSARPTSAPPPVTPEPPSETDSLAQEVALLEQARSALGQSPATALALAETHATRFPGGKLAMERELVALDALRRLGRSGEARTRGEALLARARGGLYEARIRQLIGAGSAGAPGQDR